MDIRNCQVCGSIFRNFINSEICNECYRKEEELFQFVSKFIRSLKNRKATVEQIVEKINISKDLIYKWIKIGRLKPTLFEKLEYPCNICNNPIDSGNICSNCMSELREISQTTNVEEEKKNVINQTQITYHNKKLRKRY